MAQVFALITLGFEIAAVAYGEGRHMYYLSDSDLMNASKWSQLSIIPNLFSSTISRVSLCLFIMRIVDRILMYRIFLWTIIVITSLSNLASIIWLLGECQPITLLWDRNAKGQCWDIAVEGSVVVSKVGGYMTVGCDWIMALFPILILRNLNMATKTKWALAVLMGMGIL
jgi:hypothetical protein